MAVEIRRHVITGLLVSLLLAMLVEAGPAFGANETVTLGPGNVFTPATVTINQGETVMWSNAGRGYHNVLFDDYSFEYPPTGSSSDPWVASRTFAAAGTFTYHCHVHASPGQAGGMRGTVVVLPSSAAGIPLSGDSRAPFSRLVAPKRQWVVLQRAIFAMLRVDEHATVTITAVISERGRRRQLAVASIRKALEPGVETDFHLRFRRNALRVIKRRLLRGDRLVATITVASTDAAGNSASTSRTVRVIHPH